MYTPRFNFLSRLAMVASLAVSLVAFAQPARAAQPKAARIDRIAPAAARQGEQVTITGNGFGARNVRITVGGVGAHVLKATGKRVTFVVPTGLTPGATRVAAANPGGQTGGIGFRILEGTLVSGNSNAPAIYSILDLPPVGVDKTQIENGIIMTRLDVRLAANATVGQLNSALAQVGGGIVSMMRGFLAMTIAVPRQATVEDLLALARTLSTQPGIAFAKLGREGGISDLQGDPRPLTGDAVDRAAHLLPARFPAAWNAGDKLLNAGGTCSQPKIPVLVPDQFGDFPSDFDSDIPASSFQFASGSAIDGLLDPFGEPEQHGYLVTKVLGASGFLTGANPFPQCLDFRAIQTVGLTLYQQFIDIANNFPANKFIVNYSQGYNEDCIDLGPDPVEHPELARDHCIPPRDPTIALPRERAQDALFWKELTGSRWNDFLIAVSAGNSGDTDAPNIYLGTGDSRYTNPMAIAQLPDPLFSFVEDPALWSPSSPTQVAAGFTPLFDPGDAAGMALLVHQDGLDAAVANNVLVVGGTTTISGATILSQGASPSAVVEAPFSETGPDVKAVADDVFHCGSLSCSGNSFSAPQIAGLASYLWLLSPTLRNLPASVSVTRQAIIANAWSGIGSASGLVDAYATVLSLDTAGLPNPTNAPVRLEILNVNKGGASANRFDEADIAEFLNHFFLDPNENQVFEPSTPDYSRYDLNGDGFTGGSRKERFDLDRVGSTQFGSTNYSTITQAVEGNLLEFNETALTDLDILCYYAYSDMYQGDRDVRRQLLSQLPGSQRCVFSVKPRTVTLTGGQTQQFEAIGAPGNGAVTWTATCGAVDPNTGLFTAGSSAGNCTIRATSLVDSNAFADATVTISAAGVAPRLLGRETSAFLIAGAASRRDGDTVATGQTFYETDLFSPNFKNEFTRGSGPYTPFNPQDQTANSYGIPGASGSYSLSAKVSETIRVDAATGDNFTGADVRLESSGTLVTQRDNNVAVDCDSGTFACASVSALAESSFELQFEITAGTFQFDVNGDLVMQKSSLPAGTRGNTDGDDALVRFIERPVGAQPFVAFGANIMFSRDLPGDPGTETHIPISQSLMLGPGTYQIQLDVEPSVAIGTGMTFHPSLSLSFSLTPAP
jgi:hypothetical protein